MQSEDEAKPTVQDIAKMSRSSASPLEAAFGSAPPDFALAADVQEQIGRRLAAAYDEILRQPIPERFRLLLDQLDEASKAAQAKASQERPSKSADELSSATSRERQERPSTKAREAEIE